MGSARFLPLGATFVVGGLTALQSRINGQLSATMGNSLEAAVISFASGLVVLGVIVLLVPSVRRGVARLPAALRARELAWWQILGGVLGGTFVAIQAATVPMVGVAVFTVAVVAGQSSNSLFVDQAGLGPAGRQPITVRRVTAAGLAILAVALAVANRFVDGSVSTVAVVLAFLAGVIIAVQQAINGRVARAARNPMSATVVNFIFGTVALSAALGVAVGVTDTAIAPLPDGPAWIYLGGIIGVVFIAIASWVVPIVGVLLFSLLSIAGQLSGALLLDVAAPTEGTELAWNLFAGVGLAFVAVLVAARGRSAAAPPAVRGFAA